MVWYNSRSNKQFFIDLGFTDVVNWGQNKISFKKYRIKLPQLQVVDQNDKNFGSFNWRRIYKSYFRAEWTDKIFYGKIILKKPLYFEVLSGKNKGSIGKAYAIDVRHSVIHLQFKLDSTSFYSDFVPFDFNKIAPLDNYTGPIFVQDYYEEKNLVQVNGYNQEIKRGTYVLDAKHNRPFIAEVVEVREKKIGIKPLGVFKDIIRHDGGLIYRQAFADMFVLDDENAEHMAAILSLGK